MQFPAWVWFGQPWLGAQGQDFIHQQSLCAPKSPFITVPFLPPRVRSPSAQAPTLLKAPGIHSPFPLEALCVRQQGEACLVQVIQ